MLREKDPEVWQIVSGVAREFKSRFSGWCAHARPAPQHFAACEVLHAGRVTHIISFNWDNLCERACAKLFREDIRKVDKDDVMPDRPALWKLHRDMDELTNEWVFPYQPGRVFRSLLESLDGEDRELLSKESPWYGYPPDARQVAPG